MEIPGPAALIAQIASLEAGRPLVERLSEVPGVYLVGGAVRDLLLGGRPVDLDLVVEGDVSEVAKRLGGSHTVHDRFGTSTVSTGGYAYDVARARSETYSRPGALPDVQPSPLRDDLLRRDFSVNAIAVALGGDEAGQVLAAPHALEDLEHRRLRVLHEESFRDDPTRLLRLVRYASRLGFGLDRHTQELAAAAIAHRALDTVSGPRVGSELRLLAREPDPVDALEGARGLGLDQAIHPGFGLQDPDLARRAISLLGPAGRRDRLALAAAGAAVARGELARLLDRLAFEAGDRDVIVAAATRAGEVAQGLEQARRPSDIAVAVGDAPPELVALAGATGPAEQACEWLHQLRTVGLDIDGNDLLAAGIPEGPAVGRGLRAALRAKLDGAVSGREDELAVALEAARGTG